MPSFEYKVVPAPRKGQKSKGMRSTEDKFANALQVLMNEHGAKGWEYQRTDTLPCEERSGLTGKTTVFQNMLIFRRAIEDPATSVPDRQPTDGYAEKPVPEIGRVLSETKANAVKLGGASKADSGKIANVPELTPQ